MQVGEGQLAGDLDEGVFVEFAQAVAVGGAVWVDMTCDVEEVGCDIALGLQEHAGYSQAITAVAARSAEDDDALLLIGACAQDFICDGTTGAFHQVDGCDGLMLNGVKVQFAELATRENLHLRTFFLILPQKYGKEYEKQNNLSTFAVEKVNLI